MVHNLQALAAAISKLKSTFGEPEPEVQSRTELKHENLQDACDDAILGSV